MKYIKIVVMAIAVILVQGAMAQDRLQLKAKQYYENGAYTEAITAYTRLMNKGDSSHQVIRNLADSYMKMSQYDKAVQLYDKIWGADIETLPLEHAYNYALCLRTTGNYKKSDSLMQWFSERRKNTDNRAKLFLKNKDYRYWIHAKDDDFQVVRLPQNSDDIDFAPALFANKLVFSSDRDTRIAKRNIPSDYRSKSLRIFSFEQGTNQEPSLFSESLNSKFNEASMAFSKNGDTIYLTRNSNTDRRFKRDSLGFSRLKLYRSVRKGGSWGKLEELPFNSNNYSTAHPSLSPDGKTLYFASDRPGGYGQTDLYRGH